LRAEDKKDTNYPGAGKEEGHRGVLRRIDDENARQRLALTGKRPSAYQGLSPGQQQAIRERKSTKAKSYTKSRPNHSSHITASKLVAMATPRMDRSQRRRR